MASVAPVGGDDQRPAARWFCALALGFGALYAVINPPFAGNDELFHLARAYELSRGHVRVHENARGPYSEVPKAWRAPAFAYRDLPYEPRRRMSAKKLLRNLAPEESEEQRMWKLDSPLSMRAPFAYAAMIPGVTLARALSLSTFWFVYLARLTSLGVYCALVYCALSAARSMAWAWLAAASLPALLTLAGEASPVSFSAGLAFLFVALVERSALTELQPRMWRRHVLVIGTFVCLACAEPTCLLFAFALPMLRWSEADSPAQRWGYTALVAMAGAGTAAALAYTSTGRNPISLADLAMQRQLHWMLAHPFETLAVFGRTLFRAGDDYLLHFFVVRDGLSDQLRFSAACVATLEAELLALLALGRRGAGGSARWYLVVAALYTLLVFVRALLASSGQGLEYLENVRGDFFLPLAPLLVAVLAYIGRPIAANWLTRRGGVRVLVAVVGLNAVWLLLFCARYFAPDMRPWRYP